MSGTETGRDASEMRDLLELEPVAGDRTARYGEHPAQLVEYFDAAPPAEAGPAPAGGAARLALLHGGFWRERYDRGHLTPFAAELARHGMPVALIEYRRVGGGGGYPQTSEDVAAALRLVARDGPLVVAGHSAGGQLALWAAARHPGLMRHAVAVAPLADLDLAAELGLGSGAVAEYLGPNWRELLEEADPLRLPPGVPVTLVHGTADAQVPPVLSLNYTERHPGRLLRLPGVGHYAPFVPETQAFTTLALTLQTLLRDPAR